MSDIRNNSPEEKTVLLNWLDKQPDWKREKFLKVVGDDELMTLCSSEDEFRAITGRECPFRHHLEKPLNPDEVDVPDVSEEKLEERMEQIQKAFPKPLSSDELREKIDKPMKPEKSLGDLKKLGQPELKISISIEQMKQIGNKA